MLYIDVKRKMLLWIAGKAVEEYKFGVMDNGVYGLTAKGPPHVDAFFCRPPPSYPCLGPPHSKKI